MSETAVKVENGQWKVYVTYMNFGKEKKENMSEDVKFIEKEQIPYDVTLMYVEDEKGEKADWKLAMGYREKDVLERLVKEKQARKYDFTRGELTVPKSFNKEVAGQIKHRMETYYAFLQGTVYVVPVNKEDLKGK